MRRKPKDLRDFKALVLAIDPTAKLTVWQSEDEPSARKGYWVCGQGWETKVTYSEDRAWELAYLGVSQ